MRDLRDDVVKDASQFDDVYFPGVENRLIRYYYYLNAGLGIVNNFRNLILAILGTYIALHLTQWWLLIAMLVPSLLVLTIFGYYIVHRFNKVQEWIGMRFSSHYAIRQYNYQEAQYNEMKKIRELLESELLEKRDVA